MATVDHAARVAELATRRSLYDQGLTDTEIAQHMGAKQNTISYWRRNSGLPINAGPRTFRRLSVEQRAARMLLYQLGWSDQHIAREYRVERNSVRDWRLRLKLPPNFRQGCGECNSPRPKVESVLRRIRTAVGRALPHDIAEEAVSDMMMAVLDGSIPIAQIEKEARRFGNRVLERFASKWGARSIDETIAGTDDLRIVDMLVDESSSSWLEEMGATVW